MADKEKISRPVAIKRYFDLDSSKKCGIDEIRKLNEKDRAELAVLAAKELNVDLADA